MQMKSSGTPQIVIQFSFYVVIIASILQASSIAIGLCIMTIQLVWTMTALLKGEMLLTSES